MAMHPSNAATSDVEVDRSTLCVKCGYELRGLPIGGVCPECTTIIAESLKGRWLQSSDPHYLKKLLSGNIIAFVGWLMIPAVWIVTNFIHVNSPYQRPSPYVPLVVLQIGGYTTALLLILIGCIRLTTPDPRIRDERDMDRLRLALRIAAGCLLLSSLAALLFLVLSPPARPSVSLPLELIAPFFISLTTTLHCLMNCMLRLSMRIPDPSLIRDARIHRWVLPLAWLMPTIWDVTIAPVASFTLVVPLLHYRAAKQLRSILTTGFPLMRPLGTR